MTFSSKFWTFENLTRVLYLYSMVYISILLLPSINKGSLLYFTLLYCIAADIVLIRFICIDLKF